MIDTNEFVITLTGERVLTQLTADVRVMHQNDLCEAYAVLQVGEDPGQLRRRVDASEAVTVPTKDDLFLTTYANPSNPQQVLLITVVQNAAHHPFRNIAIPGIAWRTSGMTCFPYMNNFADGSVVELMRAIYNQPEGTSQFTQVSPDTIFQLARNAFGRQVTPLDPIFRYLYPQRGSSHPSWKESSAMLASLCGPTFERRVLNALK